MSSGAERGSGIPLRLELEDFAGRVVTLSASPQNWQALNPSQKDSSRLVLLGLGPGRAWELPFVPENAELRWLEEPRTLARLLRVPDFQLGPAPGEFKGRWLPLRPEEVQNLAGDCQLWFYRPALRLAPDFWGALLARIRLAKTTPPERTGETGARQKRVWLPGNERQLLHLELRDALGQLGFGGIMENIPDAGSFRKPSGLWGGSAPDFALSINFRGLDSEGCVFYACRELEIPLAIWLVDNPWHLLAGIRYPWWRKANIFVTDPGFISGLKAAGAEKVHFLPLAASGHMWRKPEATDPDSGPLFVGRAFFPARESFFRALRLPPDLWEEAQRLLEADEMPDYHWWSARMGSRLWPGMEGRLPGLGADSCSALRRAAWLRAALPSGLRVIGDEAWKKFLPEARILPPVDYYSVLPELYAGAEAVLSITSLLLPGSLNQRHFDVWAAGGLLLCDATGGLDIFPKKLTRAMALDTPGDFGPRLDWFRKNRQARRDLISGWQAYLAKGHSYADRLRRILEKTGALPG